MSARAPRRAARLSILLVIGVLAVVPMLAACGDVSVAPAATAVVGGGDVATADRDLGAFTRISVGAVVKLIVGNAATAKVTIEAEPNILPLIQTSVVDGQLVINVPPPGFTSTKGVTITAVAPAIDSVSLSGGATGIVEADAAVFHLDISGSSTIQAIGTVKRLTFNATSAAVAKLADLHVTDAAITMADGASATMSVSGTLSGAMEGGASVTLTAKPASVSVTTSSGASIAGG